MVHLVENLHNGTLVENLHKVDWQNVHNGTLAENLHNLHNSTLVGNLHISTLGESSQQYIGG